MVFPHQLFVRVLVGLANCLRYKSMSTAKPPSGYVWSGLSHITNRQWKIDLNSLCLPCRNYFFFPHLGMWKNIELVQAPNLQFIMAELNPKVSAKPSALSLQYLRVWPVCATFPWRCSVFIQLVHLSV